MPDPEEQTTRPPWHLELPERASIFVGELKRRGYWTVANLITGIAWPVKSQKVTYRGQDYWIIPATNDTQPAVAIRAERDDKGAHRTAIMRFLSALSWEHGSGVRVSGFTGGGLPYLSTRTSNLGHVLTADFVVRDLPEPDADGQLALALMREARSLDHPAYSFLTFYRVLEAALPKGRERGHWITAALERLSVRHKEALEKVKARGIDDVGEHIQLARRQAIAHAAQRPIIDPDDYSHVVELYEELPIIQGLAELAIEEIFGILTSSTIYRQHLYELAGFREIILPELMAQIMNGPWEGISGTINLPVIDVELRRSAPFNALRSLLPLSVDICEAAMWLRYHTPDKLVVFEFELHFDEERLVFDLEDGLKARDDGSATAARNIADLLRFKLDYIGNGELHLFDADTRMLLSRVDAFLPTNFWANHEWFNAEIAKWTAEAGRRLATEDPSSEQELGI